MMEPPQFQEAPRCDVCKCSFSTFRRRHHCRCCGRSLCAEHSSNYMALPQFGLHSNVRVCAVCINNASASKRADQPTSPIGVTAATDQVTRLDITADPDSNIEPKIEQPSEKSPGSGVLVCKCGMPLCICEAPAPQSETIVVKSKTTVTSTVPSSSKTKKNESTPKSRGSMSNSKSGTVFNHSEVSNSNVNVPHRDYEASGEGLREAIKNGDIAGARKLLSQGVDANYFDKQGSSLLHLAAVFNQTEIAFALMDNGARLDCKNSQGETPLDCAPAMLQYKMTSRMEESQKMGP